MILKRLSLRTKLLHFCMFAIFVVSGCATAYIPPPLPANHPANPTAPEAPLPPPSQAFHEESSLSVSTEAAPRQESHAGHEMRHGGH